MSARFPGSLGSYYLQSGYSNYEAQLPLASRSSHSLVGPLPTVMSSMELYHGVVSSGAQLASRPLDVVLRTS
ncbi:TPA: hypothetical protein ACH3X1_005035 [Trebouxia sp. C0004]